MDIELEAVMPGLQKSLLSFMVGSPQAFIEGARTLRDLWSGSYIVSWIVAHAMKPVSEYCEAGTAEFITPDVNPQDNALLAAVHAGVKRDTLATLPSIPNKFCAMVPTEFGDKIAADCVQAARNAWQQLCNDVKKELGKEKFDLLAPNWAVNWDAQVESFFEFCTVVRPIEYEHDSAWSGEWDGIGRLMEMSRSVRHVPAYRPEADLFPPKCSLLGSFEQVGPAGLAESRKFWKSAAEWSGVGGTRLQSVDRLCAVSLVKRFAWPIVLADHLQLDKRLLRYSDTATIAAATWLQSAGIDPEKIRREHKHWSGQWLHWTQDDQNLANQDQDETACPSELFNTIKDKRASRSHGTPPIYYALLHLDGDNMGEFFSGRVGPKEWGAGKSRCRSITRQLTTFGKDVFSIVEECHGELIYCGGDDILALLPTAKVVTCAQKLNTAFSKTMGDDPHASLSGGIAIVHYKEDLRYCLNVVRKAERAAKKIDTTLPGERVSDAPRTKQALAIAVCRHSGEHSLFVMPTEVSGKFQELVQAFQNGATDRWTYKLRELLPVLRTLGVAAAKSEIKRLLSRIESQSKEQNVDFQLLVMGLWSDFSENMSGKGRRWCPEKILDHFVTLCQSAAFVARGRD